MDPALAGLIGAAVGAVVAFAGTVFTRATERQRSVRDAMIAQAQHAACALRAGTYALERRLDWHDETLAPMPDDVTAISVDALDLARSKHADAAAHVASMHLLFHHEVYSRGERAVDSLAIAIAYAGAQPLQADNARWWVADARQHAAEFAECAGADIRWPAGLVRRLLRWDKHAHIAVRVETARARRARRLAETEPPPT